MTKEPLKSDTNFKKVDADRIFSQACTEINTPGRLLAFDLQGTLWQTNPFLSLMRVCLSASQERSELMCEGCTHITHPGSDLLCFLSSLPASARALFSHTADSLLLY